MGHLIMKFLVLASSVLAAVSHFYGKRDADAGVYFHGVPFADPSGLDLITQGADPYAGYHLGKREAEADAQVLALPYAAYAAPHGVAATAFGGLVPSSLVGVCTNYLGVQVPC